MMDWLADMCERVCSSERGPLAGDPFEEALDAMDTVESRDRDGESDNVVMLIQMLIDRVNELESRERNCH